MLQMRLQKLQRLLKLVWQKQLPQISPHCPHMALLKAACGGKACAHTLCICSVTDSQTCMGNLTQYGNADITFVPALTNTQVAQLGTLA